MEDYEVNDVRNRRSRVPPLVSFEAASYAGMWAVFDVANIGEVTAEDVRFDFSEAVPWPDSVPHIFEHGIRWMPPRQRFRFMYHDFPAILEEDSTIPASFSVRISYVHPDVGTRQAFDWHIKLVAYRDSVTIRSNADLEAEKMLDQIKRLNSNIEKLCRTLSRFGLLEAQPVSTSPSSLCEI